MGLSARCQSLGTHRQLDPATDHVQSNASLVDKFGTHKGIGSEVGSLAMTSRIHHLQPGNNNRNQSGDISGGPVEMRLQNWLSTNMK